MEMDNAELKNRVLNLELKNRSSSSVSPINQNPRKEPSNTIDDINRKIDEAISIK